MKISNSLKYIICVAATSLMLSCGQSVNYEQLVVRGVSKELADFRKSTLSDLHYDLLFRIPRDKTENVTGSLTIRVNKESGGPLIIDFKAEDKQLRSVSLNGTMLDSGSFDFYNEHIVIHSDKLQNVDNAVTIDFIAGDQSLNRNKDFLYTLLVPDRARTLFPCFDQPNLKAEYNLTLEMPKEWVSVSNTPVEREQNLDEDFKRVEFQTTEPLSTYLFSFVAGMFQHETSCRGDRSITAYYRETDPDKLKQLDIIFNQVFSSLDWLEDYTGIKYPFAKYDFIILPGFQYGGMEHTGATLYNDGRMFLNDHSTEDEELGRTQLIAHETSHMWFGDLVTMDWFDDVWTKEVFANYFAAKITEPLFPNVDNSLNNLRTFNNAAMGEDRTHGTTSIQQPLDNLKNAGLVYGQIIYNKAPIMMQKMVDIMGEEAFRTGIQSYLRKFAYGNATWDDLVEILDAETSQDMKEFSRVWVKEKGMPTVVIEPKKDGFVVNQTDPLGRDLLWPQEFDVLAIGREKSDTVRVNIELKDQSYSLGYTPYVIIPNINGKGYGFFTTDNNSLSYLKDHWVDFSEDVYRLSSIMTLYENFLNHKINGHDLFCSFVDAIRNEQNQQIKSSLLNYIANICSKMEGDVRKQSELIIYDLSRSLEDQTAKLLLQRSLRNIMTDEAIMKDYYEDWKNKDNALWGENDYTSAAYELAIRMPEKADDILREQRSRISNPDRLEQFDFVSRACTTDTLRMDSLFMSLMDASNRRVEPYAERLLHYLNHPLRDKYSVKYIRKGLDILQEVQVTGDIFFPTKWLGALLGGHRSHEAYLEVEQFLEDNQMYPQLLKNKILQNVYSLEWFEGKN